MLLCSLQVSFGSPAQAALPTNVYDITTAGGNIGRNVLGGTIGRAVVPAAGAGIRLTPAGAGVSAALFAAQVFGPGAMRALFGLLPDKSANSDQVPAGTPAGSFWYQTNGRYSTATSLYEGPDASQPPIVTITGSPKHQSGGPVTVTASVPTGNSTQYGMYLQGCSGPSTSVVLNQGTVSVSGDCGTGAYAGVSIISRSSGNTAGRWQAGGSDPSGTRADPTRAFTPTAECKDASGATTYVQGQVITYKESGLLPGGNFMYLPGCPSTHPYKWAYSFPATTGGSPASSPLPPIRYPDLTNNYPACKLPGSCTLTVSPEAPPVTSQPNSVPATAPAPSAAGYYCVWGVYVLTMAECTDLGMDPDPGTGAQPRPSPTPSGSPGVVPPFPNGGQYPSPNPTRTPCGQPEDVLDPDSDCYLPDDDGDDDGDPAAEAGCFRDPTGWVDVVFEGTRCALVWAFVPPSGVRDRLKGATGQVGTRVPFGYVASIRGASSSAAEGAANSSCYPGPTMAVGGGTYQPLDLCPGSTLSSGLTPLRPALSAGLWLSMLVPLGMWVFRSSVPVIGSGEA